MIGENLSKFCRKERLRNCIALVRFFWWELKRLRHSWVMIFKVFEQLCCSWKRQHLLCENRIGRKSKERTHVVCRSAHWPHYHRQCSSNCVSWSMLPQAVHNPSHFYLLEVEELKRISLILENQKSTKLIWRWSCATCPESSHERLRFPWQRVTVLLLQG